MTTTSLPTRLQSAYDWTNAAGQLDELRTTRAHASYCRESAANAAEHGESVTESELRELRLWLRACANSEGVSNDGPTRMVRYEFEANGIMFGVFQGATLDEARTIFARDAGYQSWEAMVEQADEFGGNTVESREVLENGQLGNA